MSTLPPAVVARLNPVVSKWDGFIGKLQARVEEVLAEADAGLDALIAQHATDYGPMGAAFSALQARFHGLGSKLSDAWEKVDAEFDDARDEIDDLSAEQWWAVDDIWKSMRQKYDDLQTDLELKQARVQMKKSADWSRHLLEIAKQELANTPGRCAQCGAPMQLSLQARASKQNCASCGAVNEIIPGTAAAMFFQGHGVHSLAHEAAFQHWLAEFQAKAAFDRFRHPTAYDHWVYMQAARAYWVAYYQTAVSIDPGHLPDGVEAMVEGRLGQYQPFEPGIEQQQRDYFGALVDAAGHGEANVREALGRRPHHVDLSDCIECLIEHQQFPGAQIALALQHAEDNEDDPVQQWVAEQLTEIRRNLARTA